MYSAAARSGWENANIQETGRGGNVKTEKGTSDKRR